jgi:UPF0716 protein FxsA
MRVPISFLLLLFVLAEIASFVLVGEAIGIAGTLALTLAGMVAGCVLLRRNGIATLVGIRAELEAGRTPARPLAEGAVLAVAALLLILPGFISDIVGLLLLVPWVRGALWRLAARRIDIRTTARGSQPSRKSGVIDLDRGEYASTLRADSPWRRESEWRG